MAVGSTRPAMIHDVEKDHLMVTWKNVVVAIYKHETTVAGVASVKRVYNTCAAAHPGGVFLITIVEQGAPMPPSEVRDLLANFLEVGSGKTLMSAVVHEGSGFRAAAVRSVVTGLAMLARLSYPHQVFGSVEVAARWFASASASGLNADELAEAIAEARSRATQSSTVARAG